MKKKRIVCPECDSDNISLVTSRKKGLNILLLLLVCIIGVAVVLTLFINGYLYYAIGALVIFSVVLAILKAIQVKRREELHTKAICHDCGHKWFID